MVNYIVVLGELRRDSYYSLDRWPFSGEQMFANRGETYVGGIMSNAAAVMAALGSKVYMIGVAGTDENSRFVKSSLEGFGVDTSFMSYNDSVKVGESMVFHFKGDRNVFAIDGNYADLEVTDSQMDIMMGAKYIYTYPHFAPTIKDYPEILSKCRENGVKIIMDFESFDKEKETPDIINYCDIMLINNHDFARLRGTDTERELASYLIAKGKTLVAITKGSKGGAIYTAEETFDYKAFGVDKVIDTTGAGDTFGGALTFGLSKGLDLKEAVKIASAAAARAVTILGPKGGSCSLNELNLFMIKNKNGG